MLDIVIAAAVMGPWSMSLDDGCGLPMYRPQYMVLSPWVVQGNLILAARADRRAWQEQHRETAGKARAAQQQRRYGTYARLAERAHNPKTAAQIQAIAEDHHARRLRARLRADKARAQGYGHPSRYGGF